ncbi:uncharacterized protein N7500_006871 [Penicillium coprophilum]|uniref:uncharacterized protein n=1 Tax=Penicillium coprophilum TaxID=36646 RepID=UPI0023868D11|nr:uncharacterized protein N7500_006871 [Penicillium coprophilum]KAJ5165041.1 hypothetical protein N7500_006871 [Penicillium coprophilum]
MATHQGPPRRNGVIGFNMAGPPTPAIPLNATPRNGPIGFQMVPGPSSNATPLNLNNQGPPHRITPLVGPDTAHSSPFGQTNVHPTQRDIRSANEMIADAEAVISRQEAELSRVNSQVSALRSQVAAQRRTTRFVDQHQMDAMIHRSNNNRSRDVDAQFRILENRLDELAEQLERAEGNKTALQKLNQTLQKDQIDVQELRHIVAAAEYSQRRQERLAGAENRMNGLLRTMERMQAAAMQNTRASHAYTRSALTAESQASPVGIARRHIIGSQEPSSQIHAFDIHQQQVGKGKERGPRTLPREERECDFSSDSDDESSSDSDEDMNSKSDDDLSSDSNEDLDSISDESDLSSVSPSDSLSNVIVLDTRETSRAGTPMSISIEPTGHDLAAESQMSDLNAMVQEAPATTLAIAPQQVETYDMMELTNRMANLDLNDHNFDGCMAWEPMTTPCVSRNIRMADVGDRIPARPELRARIQYARRKNRSIFKGRTAPAWAASTYPRYHNPRFKRHRLTGFSRRFLPSHNQPHYPVNTQSSSSENTQPSSSGSAQPSSSGSTQSSSSENTQPSSSGSAQPSSSGSTQPSASESIQPSSSVTPQPSGSESSQSPPAESSQPAGTVNLPVRKRIAGVLEPSRGEGRSHKKRITRKVVVAIGSPLLWRSEVYAMNTAPKVQEMSVPAVSQPAQSLHVSTEEVPTQRVMSEPAVSQPTQTTLENTESVNTEQVPTQTVMSEPAVSQPTQTVLEYTETVSTEQVPTTAAMSVPAVPQPTQAVLEVTEQVPIDAALSEPAVSQPTQANSEEDETVETVQVPTEVVTSEPAVTEPTQTTLEPTLHESGVLECTMLGSTVSIPSDEVVNAPAPSEPVPTESAQTEPSSAEEILSVPAVTEPTLNESDLTWQTEDELVVSSLRTDTRSHLDAVFARRAAGTQARPTIMSSSGGLQVTAAPRIVSTSSLVASPEDASVKNAVATGTDSRAGVSEGTKRVEDAENPTRSAQQSAGEQREEMGGEEAATSGPQMPGAWPSDPPAVTASGESDMQEGSALLRGLWTGARRLSFGVFGLVMVILLLSPLWAGHLGHLVYALEGPDQFLEELRWEHGYDVPFLERIIFCFLRRFAGDRTLFG